MSNSGAVGGPPSNSVKSVKSSNSATCPGPRPIFDQKPMKNSRFSWPPRRPQQPFTLGITMRAKVYLKKPTGRRRRPMKILPHPAPRQIRQILAARRAPPSNPSNSGGSSGPRQIPSNSVKIRTPLGPLLSPPGCNSSSSGGLLMREIEQTAIEPVATCDPHSLGPL